MSPARDSVYDPLLHDSLLRIEINPPLPCGIDSCGRPARYGRVERDPGFASLWSLLPICEEHQMSLATGAAGLAGGSPPNAPPDE